MALRCCWSLILIRFALLLLFLCLLIDCSVSVHCLSLSDSIKTMFRRTLPSVLNIRVVSYNVLSSHLAEPSHFTTYNPDHLEASNRLPVVLKKLEGEIMNSNSRKPVIFCLQEVSYDWAGAFHAFFANRGYHLVTGLYGKKYNGYMGIALAWPTAEFEAAKVDISRLSDTREWPASPEKPWWEQLWKNAVENPLRRLQILPSEPESHWSHAARRYNVLLTAVLKHKESQQQFCIANYHMPCAFYAPKVMTTHADMAVAHVQNMALVEETSGEGDEEEVLISKLPHILAGDFNIKPVDSMYRLMTTGSMDESDPAWPTAHESGALWQPTQQEPVRSAYAVAQGREPDFTNYARVKEDDPFIDCLDYIFLSKEWGVTAIQELPNREQAVGPFPNLNVNEPSDHLLIATDLELGTKRAVL
jgi:mRNA deadenylase 3'-5' endonuclease subunit Ccr4